MTRGLATVVGALLFWAGCTSFATDEATTGTGPDAAAGDATTGDAESSPDAPAVGDGGDGGGCNGAPTCTVYNGLLASWRFENNANDSSPNHFDLPAVEPAACTPSYGPGRHGQGHLDTSTTSPCSFKKDTAWGDLGVAGRDFTIAMWVKRTAPTPDQGWAHYSLFSDGQMIVGAWQLAGGSPQYYPTIQLRDSTGQVAVAQETSFDFTQAVNTGAWMYIVAYRSATTVGIKVNDKTAVTATQTADVGPLGQLAVGEELPGGDPWQGTMDDVAIWNRALTAAEMTALYNGGAGLELIP